MDGKSENIMIRVTKSEKEKIVLNANAAKMNMSEYLLTLTHRKRIVVIPDFHKLLLEIGRIGVNINQIAKVANSQKYIRKEALEEMQKGLEEINDKMSLIVNLICETEKDHYPTMPTTTNMKLSNIETLLQKMIEDIEEVKQNGSGQEN